VPLRDDSERVFGVLAVDTVNYQTNRQLDTTPAFTPAYIDFYQVLSLQQIYLSCLPSWCALFVFRF